MRDLTTSLDIVLLAYNNPDITFRCLASLEMFAPRGHRVILVDNGSTDAVATFGPMLTSRGHSYVRLDPNQGPYAAANAGIAEAETDLVCVICNDVVVMPCSLVIMMAQVDDERPYMGATQIIGKSFDYLSSEAFIQTNNLRQAGTLSEGAFFTCFVAQRSLFDVTRVGPFDEQFLLTYGDTDWEHRLVDYGKQLLKSDAAPVYHGHSQTRKRLGKEHDMRADTADFGRFLTKWADRPDVLALHTMRTPAEREVGTNMLFDQGELD